MLVCLLSFATAIVVIIASLVACKKKKDGLKNRDSYQEGARSPCGNGSFVEMSTAGATRKSKESVGNGDGKDAGKDGTRSLLMEVSFDWTGQVDSVKESKMISVTKGVETKKGSAEKKGQNSKKMEPSKTDKKPEPSKTDKSQAKNTSTK